MKKLLWLLAFGVSGCATMAPGPVSRALDIGPFTCSNAPQCDAYMHRAAGWLQQHSYWKTRVTTDRLIQTEGPGNSPEVAFTVALGWLPDGSSEIRIRAYCGAPTCTGDPAGMTAALKQEMLDADRQK